MKQPWTEETVTQERRTLKRIQTVTLVCLVSIALLVGVFLLSYHKNHQFSPATWASTPEKRVSMVNDLLHQHELLGKTEQEILALLGVADETGYFYAENRFVYWLGAEPSLISIDSAWLLLDFENGVVVSCQVTTD